MSNIKSTLQRSMFNSRLRRAQRALRVSAEDRAAVANLLQHPRTLNLQDQLYEMSLVQYIRTNQATYQVDESQTPILDRILDFLTWMWESGLLEFLIGLLLSGALTAEELAAEYGFESLRAA